MEAHVEYLKAGVWWILFSVILWCGIHRLKQVGKPGYKTWPLIGASLQVVKNYHRAYDWILEDFKAMNTMTVCVPLVGQSVITTVDPVNVEYILKSNFHNFPKGNVFHERFEPLLGNGIFNSDGEKWKIQRKVASFEFASRKLREWSSKVFKEYALKLVGIIYEATLTQEQMEMQDLFMRMTLDTICSVGFGVKLGLLSPSLPDNEFAKAFDKCNAIVSYRFADPLWKLKRFLRIGDEALLPGLIEIVDSFTYNIIRQRRLQLETLKDAAETREDLLSRFLTMDEKFSDVNLRDIVLNFVIAGRDTTASTLTYFLYMISSHPHVAQRLQAELKQFEETHSVSSVDLNNTGDYLQNVHRFMELLTYDSLSELVYLQAALFETLRLYPAVPLNFKGVGRRDVLPNGTVVYPGDIVSYVPYCMGRTEALWGADASEFRPERWFINGAWDFNVSPYKFSAFQAGPRICIGKDSALLQMKITAAVLCRYFKFTLVPGQDLRYKVMATISLANGVKMTASLA